MKKILLTCCCSFLYSITSVWATEWTMHGSLKNETAYFVSGEKRFDKVQNSLELEPEAILSDRWEFRGRILTWYDAAMDIEATNNTDLTPETKGFYRTNIEAKEAYLLYGADDFDLRLGQQQIVWGKTDGLRMLDIINPLDMREFLLDDFLDSRIGVVAARLNYYAYLGGKEHELEFVLIPDVKFSKIAPLSSRWGFSMPTMPAGIAPTVMNGVKPENSAKNMEYGLAWRSNMNGWDVSLNGFYGWKNMPNIEKTLSGTTMFLKPVYSRLLTLGGSFSNAFGVAILRGEMAVNLDESLDATGITPSTSINKTTTWNAALGIDYSNHNWILSPQIFMRYILAWDNTLVEKSSSGFVSLLVATDFMNEKLKPEVIGLIDWTNNSWMLRPKVEYVFDDQITGVVGLDIFNGQQGSFFGQFADNDRVYVEMTYSF